MHPRERIREQMLYHILRGERLPPELHRKAVHLGIQPINPNSQGEKHGSKKVESIFHKS